MGNHSNHPTAPIEKRFWSKVAKTKRNECWWWKASIDVNGYGQFGMSKFNSVGNKVWTMAKAHRVAWILTHGEIPPGMFLCHSCDMPRCVNPSHLFLGTQTDNMQDCVSKGRHGFGRVGQPIYYNITRVRKIIAAYKAGVRIKKISQLHEISPTYLTRVLKRHKIPLQEKRMSKLTAIEIQQIRDLYASGTISQRKLGERFGVTGSNISCIIRGHSWPELPVNPNVTIHQKRRHRKLTIADVREIHRLWESGITQTEIGVRFGVHNSTVNHAIHKRKTD